MVAWARGQVLLLLYVFCCCDGSAMFLCVCVCVCVVCGRRTSVVHGSMHLIGFASLNIRVTTPGVFVQPRPRPIYSKFGDSQATICWCVVMAV